MQVVPAISACDNHQDVPYLNLCGRESLETAEVLWHMQLIDEIDCQASCDGMSEGGIGEG